MSIKRLSGAGLTTPKSNKLWDQTTFQSGMFALATISLVSSQTSVVFSGIPSNYTNLQLRVTCGTTTNASVNMYFNADTSASSANYAYHRLVGDGSGTSAAAGTSLPRILDLSGNSTYFYGAVIDLFEYTSTTKNKLSRCLQGYDTNGGSPTSQVTFTSQLWLPATPVAINTITLAPTSGSFVANSHFALYGIKVA